MMCLTLFVPFLLWHTAAEAFVIGNSEQQCREDVNHWIKNGQEQLRWILSSQENRNKAKNIIIFIGDGMGLSTVTSGRIFKGQQNASCGEEYKLTFERFPYTGLSKTYNLDKQVPDSAGTATAIFSGVKAKYRMLGLADEAKFNVCNETVDKRSRLSTIADWAQEIGKDTGFVTTTRVTHATPAALYAHINNRDWESDVHIPYQQRDCVKDIARQLVEDAPGNGFKVIMGGGARNLGLQLTETSKLSRNDSRQLAKEWLEKNPGGQLVTTAEELLHLDINATDKIMGIFWDDHLPYAADKPECVPTLANMTVQAIRLLQKNDNGFFLMVEGGKIDLAHHENYAKLALREVAELDDAVAAAMANVNEDETLIIVTADHSHSFTINGYPDRGNDIFGFTTKNVNKTRYETLSYANGPGYDYHHGEKDNSVVNRTWPDAEDLKNKESDPYYRHFAGMYLKTETHGGEDVGVYAIGPYAHLFRSTFEQSYIAHAVAYAACFNKTWSSHCNAAPSSNFSIPSNPSIEINILLR